MTQKSKASFALVIDAAWGVGATPPSSRGGCLNTALRGAVAMSGCNPRLYLMTLRTKQAFVETGKPRAHVAGQL